MPTVLSKLSTLTTHLSDALLSFLSFPTTHLSKTANKTTTILALALPATLAYALYALPATLASYRTYLAIGPGGLPHNFFGFVVQGCMRVVARGDVRGVPAPYFHTLSSGPGSGGDAGGGGGDGDHGVEGREIEGMEIDAAVVRRYEPYGRTSFLVGDVSSKGNNGGSSDGGGLTPRSGPRPTIPPFVAPQRQTSMQAPQGMISRMRGFLDKLAETNSTVLEIRPSGLEGKWHSAVFLRDDKSVPGFMGMAKGEIAHVHPEGSSHVTVSLVDGEEAVARGWAERHPLSGRFLPWSYVMVYAPRDDEEYQIWARLVVAGSRFVSGKEIKLVEA